MGQTQSVQAAWYEDDGEGRPCARIGDEFTLNDGDRLMAPAVGERVWLVTLADSRLDAQPVPSGSIWFVRNHR